MQRYGLYLIGGGPAVTSATGAGGVPGKPADMVEELPQYAIKDGLAPWPCFTSGRTHP